MNMQKKVWKSFNISNMGEYHDLYVQSDTAQLADVYEQFRTLVQIRSCILLHSTWVNFKCLFKVY